MTYTIIEDFAGGWDTRKTPITTRPGALVQLENAFVNAGGEIEKRKTFTLAGTLPPGTMGLSFADNKAYVFGSDAGPASGLPSFVQYQQLVTADTALEKILTVSRFAERNYVIARMGDGTVRHFYDGAEIVEQRNKGTYVTPHKMKVYVCDGPNLRFSALNAPTDFAGTGSGLVDITAHDVGSTTLLAAEPYYSNLALFGETSIQVWSMDPDPLQNTQVQVLGNIGLVAPEGVAQYGSGDVLFLSHTGIRSLRARDSSNAAVLNDIGSPIDAAVAQRRARLTPEVAAKIKAIVDPLTGHFWLVWGEEIFVLALYPASKVTAWSLFKPNMNFDQVVLANSRLLCRRGDDLFVYGTLPSDGNPFDVNAPVGTDASEYDATQVNVVTPYLSFGAPATVKLWTAVDVACEGTWDVYANPDPRSNNTFTRVAEIKGTSYPGERIPLNMQSTHIQFKLVSRNTGPARLSALGVHYESGESS